MHNIIHQAETKNHAMYLLFLTAEPQPRPVCRDILAEWLGAVRFEGKNHCPVEANTSVRLLILYGVPIVNK
jgi:hypothetical protein